MTPENFCYWLKGIFEIQEAGIDKNEKRSIKLTDAQLAMINEHLGYVFLPKQKDGTTITQSFDFGGDLDKTQSSGIAIC